MVWGLWYGDLVWGQTIHFLWFYFAGLPGALGLKITLNTFSTRVTNLPVQPTGLRRSPQATPSERLLRSGSVMPTAHLPSA